ncbi:MAG: patatin-like protein [Sphingopyxis sp.]
MREKELRLALVCYGGISLAVYMHGVTKEIWHLARASRAELDGEPPSNGVIGAYRALLSHMADGASGVKLRVLADIIAGASAGGINGIFLARALSTGESLEPLTDLWLTRADVTVLLDPDARPWSRFSKFWAVPIAWLYSRTPKNAIDTTVERSARAEVRAKLSQFVRARWFAPPFGGEVFSGLLLDAFAAMQAGPKGPRLIPDDQPIDLMVTVTDYSGHEQAMRLNSPPEVEETEHRLIFSFRRAAGHKQGGQEDGLADGVGLAFAARATASFPGAFPPFTVRELDHTLKQRGETWLTRNAFLAAQLCTRTYCSTEDRILVDGSVLANAPFKPAIAALRQRPARREVDRRFVYIDPKPGIKSISLTAQKGGGKPELPGFFGTIFKTMSDIPRSQPIRDNVEALDHLSARIRRMRKIMDSMHGEVEERIEAALGRTFFINRPTAARLAAWRAKAQGRAVAEAGYVYAAYGHLKLSLIVEELARVAGDMVHAHDEHERGGWRAAIWVAVRARGWDNLRDAKGRENAASIGFFRSHDVGYRIRRLRLLARRLDDVAGLGSGVDPAAGEAMRGAIYQAMGLYLDRESRDFYAGVAISDADLADAGPLIDRLGVHRGLQSVDDTADALIADGLTGLPKDARRALAYSYLGFPFYDAATLPLLQGEGDGEFDPVKIDRISPDDATAIRKGGAAATLKGIQFNSFGAFFSRSFRENDYLWGRLHAAERLLAIVASAHAGHEVAPEVMADLRRAAFTAILSEEEGRLTHVHELIAQIRREIG